MLCDRRQVQMCRRVGAASVDEAFPGRLRRVRAPGIPIPAGRSSTARHTHHGVLSGADGSQAPPGLAGPPELPGLFAIADPRRTGHCGTERSCVRAFTIDRPRFVTAGILRPGSAASSPRAGRPVAAAATHRASAPPTGKGGRALGDGPGGSARSPLRVPGRPATVRWQIWQRVTGRWVAVMGKRRELGLLIRSGDAGPVAVTVPCAARTPHGTDEGSWPAGRVNSG